MRRLGWILVAAAGLASGLGAASTDLGGVFQDIEAGTRPLGMGGAFVALADDGNAVEDNPAGMAFFAKTDRFADFTHSNLFSSGVLSRDDIAYAQADSGFGAFGLAWNRLSADLSPEQWTEDEYIYAGAKLLSVGEDKYPKLAIGWQAKYLRVDSGFSDSTDGTTVGNGTATGYGLSAGLMVKLRPSLSLGLMAQDLYSSLSWATGTLEIIPMTGRFGGAYKMTEHSTLAAEVRGTQGSSGFELSSWHLGGEFWLLDGKNMLWNAIRNVAARAGFYQLLNNDDGGRVTVGATAKADMWQLDYAYDFGLSNSSLGGTHRFGLGVNF
jgi:hypothetical protein